MSHGLPQFDPTFYSGEIFWLIVSFGALWGAFQFWILPRFYQLEKQRKKSLDHIMKDVLQLEEKNSSLRQNQQKRLGDLRKNIDLDHQKALEQYSNEKQLENTALRGDYEDFLKTKENYYQELFQKEKESLNQKKIKELLNEFISVMKK